MQEDLTVPACREIGAYIKDDLMAPRFKRLTAEKVLASPVGIGDPFDGGIALHLKRDPNADRWSAGREVQHMSRKPTHDACRSFVCCAA